MREVENTGERILLDKETPLMIARHFCAYAFAKDYCQDKKILDVGCGEGYGAHFLTGAAQTVVAVDRDADVIEYARGKYKSARLRFEVRDIQALRSMEEHFDGITCFQVIEHLADAGHFLGIVQELLAKGGLFICSTCNRLDSSGQNDIPLNRFHVKEYLCEEFSALLTPFFASLEIFGVARSRKQKFYRALKKSGICNLLPEGLDPVKRYYANASLEDFVISKEKLDTALDFIALCRK